MCKHRLGNDRDIETELNCIGSKDVIRDHLTTTGLPIDQRILAIAIGGTFAVLSTNDLKVHNNVALGNTCDVRPNQDRFTQEKGMLMPNVGHRYEPCETTLQTRSHGLQ